MREMRAAVVIPVFNDLDGLKRTLLSLEREPSALIVVVDDGSDPPVSLDDINSHHKIVLIRIPRNSGIETALNAGLQLCLQEEVDVVARIDAGDTWVSGRLTKQMGFLKENPDHVLVGGQAVFVDRLGRRRFQTKLPITHEKIVKVINYRCPFIHPAVMFRTNVLKKAGLYRKLYPAAEDYDMWYRFMKFGRCANLRDVVVLTEINLEGISAKKRRTQKMSSIRLSVENAEFSNIHWYFGLLWKVFVGFASYRHIQYLKYRIHQLRTLGKRG